MEYINIFQLFLSPECDASTHAFQKNGQWDSTIPEWADPDSFVVSTNSFVYWLLECQPTSDFVKDAWKKLAASNAKFIDWGGPCGFSICWQCSILRTLVLSSPLKEEQQFCPVVVGRFLLASGWWWELLHHSAPGGRVSRHNSPTPEMMLMDKLTSWYDGLDAY